MISISLSWILPDTSPVTSISLSWNHNRLFSGDDSGTVFSVRIDVKSDIQLSTDPATPTDPDEWWKFLSKSMINHCYGV